MPLGALTVGFVGGLDSALTKVDRPDRRPQRPARPTRRQKAVSAPSANFLRRFAEVSARVASMPPSAQKYELRPQLRELSAVYLGDKPNRKKNRNDFLHEQSLHRRARNDRRANPPVAASRLRRGEFIRIRAVPSRPRWRDASPARSCRAVARQRRRSLSRLR